MANTTPTRISLPGKPILNNLPPPVRPFVDREEEIARVTRLLLDPDVPIVNIVGLAGIGKTALALEVAHRLLEQGQFPDGVCWVYCRDRDQALADILQTVQRIFDLRPRETSHNTVRQYLATHTALLVLNEYDAITDDFEVLGFLGSLAGPSKALLTSRLRAARLARTAELQLDGLALEDGVHLFQQTAESYGTSLPHDDEASIAELVQLLSGHPWAIRLAAAQTERGSLPLETLRQRLSEGWPTPELEAVFDASTDMLSKPARALFRRLAVFTADFDEQAIFGVCEIDDWQDVAVELEQTDLVRRVDRRYQLHPLVRAAALAELERHNEREEYEQRAAAYYLALAQAAESAIQTGQLSIASDVIRAEIANMLAGQEWYWKHEHWQEVIAYGDALYNLLVLGDLLDARLIVVQRALTASKRISDTGGEARLQPALADVYQMQGRLSEAIELYEQSLASYRRAGDQLGAANTRKSLGDLALRQADLAAAGQHYRVALADFQAIGDRLGAANTRESLGDLALRQDDLTAAGQHYWAALADYQAIGARLGAANTRESLGDLALRQDDLAAAEQHYWAALADFRAIGARLGAANTRKSLGDLALRQADLAAAGQHYWAALADFQAIGDRLGAANTRLALGDLALRQDDLTAAEQHYWAVLADYQTIGARLGAANTRKSLGDLALRQDDLTAAGQHYWAALADFQAIGDRLGAANTRLALGDLALRQDDLTAAGQHYWAALADYQAIGARLGAANTRKALGDLALRQDDLAGAGELYRAALADYQAIGARLGEANSLTGLANVHRLLAIAAIRSADALAQKTRYREALEYLDRSSDLFESIGDTASLAVVQRMRARIFDELKEREFDETIAALTKALNSSLASASQSAALRAAGSIVEFGKRLVAQARYRDTLHLTTRLTEELERIERDANRVYERPVSPEATEIHRMLKEPPPAYQTLMRYDHQVLEAAGLIKSVLSVIARVATARMNGVPMPDHDAALQALELGRQVDRTTGQAFHLAQWVRESSGFELVELEDADDWPPQVAYLVHLAARHERDENWEAAIESYRQACELLSPAKSERELARSAEIGFRLALCLKQAGRWSEVIKQQEANIATYRKLGDLTGKANAYMEMGHIYQMMNLYDPALLYYGEAYYLYRQVAEAATDDAARRAARHGMANAKESLGNLEFQLKVLPKGVTDLEEARALYLELGMPGKAAVISQTLETVQTGEGGNHG
jgi:tetratricopeptide (TPR) repeat protein